ncbi:MAG: hypothetical protein AVDCRST_MAG73-3452, partial [uncultured Thermomicrobiales bacterium]
EHDRPVHPCRRGCAAGRRPPLRRDPRGVDPVGGGDPQARRERGRVSLRPRLVRPPARVGAGVFGRDRIPALSRAADPGLPGRRLRARRSDSRRRRRRRLLSGASRPRRRDPLPVRDRPRRRSQGPRIPRRRHSAGLVRRPATPGRGCPPRRSRAGHPRRRRRPGRRGRAAGVPATGRGRVPL